MANILLAIIGWDPKSWDQRFRAAAPQHDIRLWPERVGDPAAIDYACVWRPPHGMLGSFPNLKAVFTLGAGVDHLIADPALPDVPVVRIVDPDLTMRMTEYVVLHVLKYHRQQRLYETQQRERRWRDHDQPAASEVAVGVLGLGVHHPDLSHEESERRVIRALIDVGLDPGTRFRYPHEFSGGQRQRIALARAVVLEPTFVVLDEPTSALDMLIQSQMVDLLRELQKRLNLTYLFISHDLRVVAALASRLIVMRHGKVVEEGPAVELFARPQSDYTRALFAAAFNLETAPEGVVAQ